MSFAFNSIKCSVGDTARFLKPLRLLAGSLHIGAETMASIVKRGKVYAWSTTKARAQTRHKLGIGLSYTAAKAASTA
jgi:hypothetical protein